MTDGVDIARVRQAFAAGTLMHPAAGSGGTLVDLARTLGSLCGAPVEAPANGGALRGIIGEHEHYVFVLVDGLGAEMVARMPGSFVAEQCVARLTTVFPSSTAPALTALATGVPPCVHAVTGWWVRLPRHGITATILPFIERWSERPLARFGVRREEALLQPSMLGRMDRDVLLLQPKNIAGSVSSTYFAGGAAQAAYDRLSDAIDVTVGRVEGAARPTYTYMYIPFVDAMAHERGPHDSHTMLTARRVDRRLAELAGRLSGRARLVITADHGGIDMPRAHRRVYSSSDPLIAMLEAPPAGEPRTPVFHLRAGQREAFVDRFREELGRAFALVTPDEAASEGLLGDRPLSDAARERLGDYIGVALGGDALLCDPSADLAAMQGHHGGLTPDEMEVPLIVV